MIKRSLLPVLLSLILFLLASCATAGTPSIETSVPTSIPPTPKVLPSNTPVPPTEIPTAVLPTAIPTILPVNPIQHFASGQEFTVTDIHMIDANVGWAIGGLVGAGDHVLLTADGGVTWKDVTPPEEQSAASDDKKTATGFFQDAQAGWVIYSNTSGITPVQSIVWRTQDGGATWQASQPLDISELTEFYNPSDLQFINGQTGWMLVHVGVGMNHDYVVLYRSQDGGLTWERVLDPYNDGGIQSCVKTSMLFTDATHGWLTGDCGGVMAGALLYKTTDAGSSWEQVTLPEPTNYPGLFSNDAMVACGSYDPFFFGNDVGHLNVKCQDYQGTQITYSYYIYTTLDGGSTWTMSTYPGEALYFITPDTGWALSNKIQISLDGGNTWKAIADVTWSARMDFINERVGWGIAREGDQVALVKTEDGGTKWNMLVPSVGQ